MINYDYIINKYEGRGIPYYDRSDDIRIIVLNLCKYMYSDDKKIIKQLILSYENYRFINSIRVEGRKCIIDYDDGVISFSVFPYKFFNNFCDDVLKINDTCGQCHNITQKVLEKCSCDYISAITSLCVSNNFFIYFHSYICDRRENNIIDFSKKLIMSKDNYDKLFCHKQINDYNYNEYINCLNNSQYGCSDSSIFPLLYLSLEKLKNEENVYCKKMGL